MRISRRTMLQGMIGGTAALASTGRLPDALAIGSQPAGKPPIIFAWLLNNEPAGLASLQAHVGLITHLSPSWFSIHNDLSITGSADPLVSRFASTNGLALHPLINNAGFDPLVAERILQSPQSRDLAAQRIADLVVRNDFDGINIDFEGTFGTAREQYADFIQRLSSRLRPLNKRVTVDVVPRLAPAAPHPVTSWSAPFDYAGLGAAADAVILMAYDYTVQQPGAISPLWWVHDLIAYARTQIPDPKLVVALPSYGRQWITAHGQTSMSSLTQVEAHQLLAWTGASVSRPTRDGTPRFTWEAVDGTHTVHYDDRQSLTAKLQAVDAKLGGVAFWRLGREHPMQWSVLRDWIHARTGS